MKEATKIKKINELEALIKKAEDKILRYKQRIQDIKDTPTFTYKVYDLKEYAKRNYNKNKEYYKQYYKEWRRENSEYIRKRQKESYAAMTPKQRYESNRYRKYNTYEEMLASRKYSLDKEGVNIES